MTYCSRLLNGKDALVFGRGFFPQIFQESINQEVSANKEKGEENFSV